jgi:hypothetical protein
MSRLYQAMFGSSNATSPWVPPACSSENWSNGSALAVLFGLAIAGLAHPRGSLTYNKSGRIWRLSPHLAFVEALNLVSNTVWALRRGHSLHIICVTLLAVRAGNSMTSIEYELFQEEWREKQREERQESTSISHGSEPIPTVGRSNTIEAEEGRANVDLHRRITRVGGPLRGDPEEASEGVQDAPPDTLFLAQLEETERYEKGFTLRAVAWIPILLAALKMIAVTGGWSLWGPKVCGWMFFVSWFITELVFIRASRHRLSTNEREKVLSLSREWRKSWFLPWEKMKSVNAALCFSDDYKKDSFELGPVACTVLLGFNSWPLIHTPLGVYARAVWRAYIWTVNHTLVGERSDWALLILIPLSSFLSTFGLMIFAYPSSLYFFLIYFGTSGWVLYVMEIGVLFQAGRLGVSENRLSRWGKAMKVDDSDGLVAGHLAFLQAFLTVLRYARVLNDYASYDCSMTTQAAWYDWTL